jgi:hypothetical protein
MGELEPDGSPELTQEAIPLGPALNSRAGFRCFAGQERLDLERALLEATDDEVWQALFDWTLWARDDQLPPVADWTTWLMMGGRGAGKTRAGAEWVKGWRSACRLPGRRPGASRWSAKRWLTCAM